MESYIDIEKFFPAAPKMSKRIDNIGRKVNFTTNMYKLKIK
jgi:tetrahydromethanopterin S-methyltransferase subunit G